MGHLQLHQLAPILLLLPRLRGSSTHVLDEAALGELEVVHLLGS